MLTENNDIKIKKNIRSYASLCLTSIFFLYHLSNTELEGKSDTDRGEDRFNINGVRIRRLE